MAKGTVIKGKSDKKLPDSNTDVVGAFSKFLQKVGKSKSPSIKKKKKDKK